MIGRSTLTVRHGRSGRTVEVAIVDGTVQAAAFNVFAWASSSSSDGAAPLTTDKQADKVNEETDNKEKEEEEVKEKKEAEAATSSTASYAAPTAEAATSTSSSTASAAPPGPGSSATAPTAAAPATSSTASTAGWQRRQPLGNGIAVYDVGYANTAICRSAISYIDSDRGVLRYAVPQTLASAAESGHVL